MLKLWRLCLVAVFSLFCLSFFAIRPALAAQTYDQTNGTYTDDFANNTGVPTRSGANVNGGVLQLTNAAGGFTAPLNTSGNVVTASLAPTSVAKWGTVNWTGNVPEGTTVKFQVLDEASTLYPDSVLAGNAAGFSATSFSLESLPPFQMASTLNAGGKPGRIKLKISFTRADSSDTPTVDSLTLSWTVSQGTFTASALSSPWPVGSGLDFGGTNRVSYVNANTYPAFRWSTQTSGMEALGIYTSLVVGNSVISGGIGNGLTDGIRSLNRDSGSLEWTMPMTTYGFPFALADNTYAVTDVGTDNLLVLDLATRTFKWTYSFGGGHGNDQVIRSVDGNTYYVFRQLSNNTNITLFAFDKNGTLLWNNTFVNLGSNLAFFGRAVMDSGGTMYFIDLTYTSGYSPLNQGKLYAINSADGSIKWQYSTGDGIAPPVVDPDGTIYAANNTSATTEKKLYAINPDGTLKWSKSFGTTSQPGFTSLSLRSDNTLVGYWDINGNTGMLKALSTVDGSEIWSVNLGIFYSYSTLVVDNNNGVYLTGNEENLGSSIYRVTLYYVGSDGTIKWKIPYSYSRNDGANLQQGTFRGMALDERGWVYSAFEHVYVTGGGAPEYSGAYLNDFALAPWTLAVNLDKTSGLTTGDKITFTATSAMGRTNPLFGGNNAVQIVVDDKDKIGLSYSSTNSSGDTVWTGTYTIPSSLGPGVHTYTLEAAQSYLQTDQATHFDSSPDSSGNTGLSISGQFTIGPTYDADPNCPKLWKYCISSGPKYIGPTQWVSGGGDLGAPAKVWADGGSQGNDLYLAVERNDFNNLAREKIPYPWDQGWTMVGDVYNIRALSAFNGYLLGPLDKPAIIVLPYPAAKLPKDLRIVYLKNGRWLQLTTPLVIDAANHTIATTTKELGRFVLVEGGAASQKSTEVYPVAQTSEPQTPFVPQTNPAVRPALKPKTCFLFLCW